MPTFVDADSLAQQVCGPVFLPGDEGFAAEIFAWNVATVHQPAVVVGATDAGDVAAAVRWAARHELPVAIQATGHGQYTPAAGGLLITTRRMAAVSIDPVAKTARIEAGARWAQVIEAGARYGLAPLNGSSPLVGAVGYTLGGGLSVIARSYGFAADHVRAFTVVTADGLVRTVDAVTEPDLFWALRGAGKANFGVVTEMVVDLVAVTRLYGGGIFFPASAAAHVLHAFRTWSATLTEQTSTSIAMLRLPDLPQLPEPLRGQFVVHLRLAHLGSAAEGEQIVAPMRAVAPALIDTVAEMNYTQVGEIHADPVDPMPAYDSGAVLKNLPAEAIDALLAAAGPQVNVPLAMVELRLLGGAIAGPPAVPNAVSGRHGAYSLLAIGPLAPGLEQVVPAVVASVLDAMEPFTSTEALANFTGAATANGVPFAAWSEADRDRLLEIKKQYDPSGLFQAGSASSH
ncbi:MAG TPA: FAD-binding oxidoreductase [Micromonosporaceae bacterium]